jgi:hypothetical protein
MQPAALQRLKPGSHAMGARVEKPGAFFAAVQVDPANVEARFSRDRRKG